MPGVRRAIRVPEKLNDREHFSACRQSRHTPLTQRALFRNGWDDPPAEARSTAGVMSKCAPTQQDDARERRGAVMRRYSEMDGRGSSARASRRALRAMVACPTPRCLAAFVWLP